MIIQETFSSEEDDVLMDDIDNVEDAIAKFEHINIPDVKRGMFVSGWDDPDDSVEEDENPEGKSLNSLPHQTPNHTNYPPLQPPMTA